MPLEHLPEPPNLDSRIEEVKEHLRRKLRGADQEQLERAIKYLLFYSPDDDEVDYAFAQAKGWFYFEGVFTGGPSEFIGLASFLSRYHGGATIKCHDHNPPLEVTIKLENGRLVYECTGKPPHKHRVELP